MSAIFCSVKVDDGTIIEDPEGKKMSFSDLSQGDTVTVTFAEGVNVRKGHTAVQAAKIIRLRKAEAAG
ncbi:hypothetical protein [Paenibacillus silvisoli]|uniref:hypothetical protein n=1 Tax=Paenibacillus silvisoli TaxID=3110539 RepID=UPI002805F912|nr:hypothetical protein [Paenibacillus silvisoli]